MHGRLIKYKYISIFFLINVLTFPAHASWVQYFRFSKTNYCASTLESLNSSTSVSGDSGASLKAAIAMAQTFREFTLWRPQARASLEAVEASYFEGETEVPGSTKAQIAARLQGIEELLKAQSSDNSSSHEIVGKIKNTKPTSVENLTNLMGATFRGEAAILRYLAQANRLASQLNTQSRFEPFQYLWLSGSLMEFLFTAKHLDNPVVAIGSLAFFAVFSPPIWYPLQYISKFRVSHERILNDQRKALRFLKGGKAAWSFSSINYKLRNDVLRDILDKTSARSASLFLSDMSESSPAHYAWLLKNLRPRNEDTPVIIDELLTKDPDTHEPVLSIFIRTGAISKPRGDTTKKRRLLQTILGSLLPTAVLSPSEPAEVPE